MIVTILLPGNAPSFHHSQKRGFKDLFYGKTVVAAATRGSLLTLHRQNGKSIELDMALCSAGGRPVDWVSHIKDERRLLTDAIVGWSSSEQLEAIYREHFAGNTYPTLMEARVICRHLHADISRRSEDVPLLQATLELAAFMKLPPYDDASAVTIAQQHAETIRAAFLPLGIIFNALSLVVGIDQGQVKELRLEIRTVERADPAGALFDEVDF